MPPKVLNDIVPIVLSRIGALTLQKPHKTQYKYKCSLLLPDPFSLIEYRILYFEDHDLTPDEEIEVWHFVDGCNQGMFRISIKKLFANGEWLELEKDNIATKICEYIENTIAYLRLMHFDEAKRNLETEVTRRLAALPIISRQASIDEMFTIVEEHFKFLPFVGSDTKQLGKGMFHIKCLRKSI